MQADQTTARQVLEREAARQTFETGLNREQAFAYHRFSLELFLLATRTGLLEFRWEILCPLCRGAKDTTESLALLRQPRLRMLLICSALHWSAMGPYHSFFALHVKALALSPSLVLMHGWGGNAQMMLPLAAPLWRSARAIRSS